MRHGRQLLLRFGAVAAITAGFALLALSIAGELWPTRGPGPMPSERPVAGYHYATLSRDEPQKYLAAPPARADLAWLTGAHEAVSLSLQHGLRRLSFRDDWVLWLAENATGNQYLATQDVNRILEGGEAFCSQSAEVLRQIAARAGVSARLISFDGHVVVEVETVDRGWVVADTDYGILYPFDLEDLRSQPDHLIVERLVQRGFDEASADQYLGFIRGPARRHPVGEHHEPLAWRWEQRARYVRWFSPVLLIGAGTAIGLGRILHSRRAAA